MWAQGEHIAIVGDTGSGKTFLESRLLPIRSYVIVLRTKADDIKFPGFRRARHTDRIQFDTSARSSRWLLEPNYREQSVEGYLACEKVWREHNWCLAVDELWYAEAKLGLTSSLDRLLTQGRSLGISVVCGMQRPARVSRFALSQCTHLFAFRCEGRDVQSLAEAFTPEVKAIMPRLGRYEYLYFYRPERRLSVGTAQSLGEVLA